MFITEKEKNILRQLGSQYMEAASLPLMQEKIGLWKSLNRRQMQRPMVCIDQLPWNELSADDGELTCLIGDPFWRSVEWDLRTRLYQWKRFAADMVLDPFITIPQSIQNTGYGLRAEVERLELFQGTTAAAQHFTDVLKDENDIIKIKDMHITADTAENKLRMQQAEWVFDGVAPIILGHGIKFHLGIWDYMTQLMSIEDAYYAIVDRPEFIHACLERVTQATIAGIEQANELEVHDDIANRCHCSYIYTDELLPDSGQGKGPLSKNCWAYGMAQLFTSVSPRITEEFEIPYISRMASRFGMLYYGCCERLDDRMELVQKIPNVVKVSCSPWSDREQFAEKIGDMLIMSAKPSPAFLSPDIVDWEAVRDDLARTVKAARTYKVNLELILKDISTVRFEPERLTKWCRIAMEVVQKY